MICEKKGGEDSASFAEAPEPTPPAWAEHRQLLVHSMKYARRNDNGFMLTRPHFALAVKGADRRTFFYCFKVAFREHSRSPLRIAFPRKGPLLMSNVALKVLPNELSASVVLPGCGQTSNLLPL